MQNHHLAIGSGINMDETEQMSPDINAPRMEKIYFSVPEPLLRQALDIAEAEGWKPAELHRIFWERGFAQFCEGSNKRLINERLRRKASQDGDADESP